MTPVTKPVNFLLVDDLAENLLALEALLQREGLVCLKARSGEEALELLLVHDIALALLDVQMPGMDGFQLAEFMRGNARARYIPIIFVTAGTADSHRRFQGYEAGAVDFIQKPIEPDVLRSKASVFFDLHQQRQLLQAQRDALQSYSDQLQIADQHKTQFIAMLGHELRNPIMAIKSGVELLKKPRDPALEAEIRERMGTQVHHLTRLVEDLLDISRVNQGKVSLKPETIALSTVVRSAVETIESHMNDAGHDFTVVQPDEPIWLHADHTRIAQVLGNLLTNAARYTPPGGRITLSARAHDGVAEILVADNGIGIPLDKQAKIFEVFEQVKPEGGIAQSGLGIGLALVKQLVELHSGTITVKSAGAGAGSTFTVRLPVLAVEA